MDRPLHAIIVDNFIISVFPWDQQSPLSFSILANSTIMLLSTALEEGYGYMPEPVYVPNEIHNYQLREWLIKAGKKDLVEQIISNITDPLQKELVRNRWEYAINVPRNHILVEMIGKSLGMTSEQIDQAFIDAEHS
jgi:hypothetical protein